MVEFAFVVVLLITLLYGIISYGLILAGQSTITQAAADAARSGIVASTTGRPPPRPRPATTSAGWTRAPAATRDLHHDVHVSDRGRHHLHACPRPARPTPTPVPEGDGDLQLQLEPALPRAARPRHHHAVDALVHQRPPDLDAELVGAGAWEASEGSVERRPATSGARCSSSRPSPWWRSSGPAPWAWTSGSPCTAAGRRRPWPTPPHSTSPAHQHRRLAVDQRRDPVVPQRPARRGRHRQRLQRGTLGDCRVVAERHASVGPTSGGVRRDRLLHVPPHRATRSRSPRRRRFRRSSGAASTRSPATAANVRSPPWTPESGFSIGSYLATINTAADRASSTSSSSALGTSANVTALGYQGLANTLRHREPADHGLGRPAHHLQRHDDVAAGRPVADHLERRRGQSGGPVELHRPHRSPATRAPP